MDEESLKRRVESFLVCNRGLLDWIGNSEGRETMLLKALHRYLGSHISIDTCRDLLASCSECREFLVIASRLWNEENKADTQRFDNPPTFQNPAEVMLTNSDLSYKGLIFLNDLTRLVLSLQELDLKNTLVREDFSISKEKVITSYLKFFSLRTQFYQIKNKVISIYGKNWQIEENKLTHGSELNESGASDSFCISKSEPREDQLNKNSESKGSKNNEVLESQIFQFLKKVNSLLLQHTKVLWITQFTLANLQERKEKDRTPSLSRKQRPRSLSANK